MGLMKKMMEEEKEKRQKERRRKKRAEAREKRGEPLPLEPPFLGIEFKQLMSEPWLRLSPQAVRLYLYMWVKSYKTSGSTFSFTYAEAKELLGMHGTTYKNAVIELSEYGFIEVVRVGKFPFNSLYQLSSRWKNFILPAQIEKIEKQVKMRKKKRELLDIKQRKREEEEQILEEQRKEKLKNADDGFLDELLER